MRTSIRIIAIALLTSFSPFITFNVFAKHIKIDSIKTGDHIISLHWLLLSNNYGIVNIAKPDNNGWQIIKGKQEGVISGKPAFLEINGILKKDSVDILTFKGIVRTQIPNNYNGKVCERTGVFTFSQIDKRKYWRMHPLKNCEGSIDYIDIYL